MPSWNFEQAFDSFLSVCSRTRTRTRTKRQFINLLIRFGMISLKTPVSESAIRTLKVGDEVGINGTLFTGRDAVHKYLHDGGKLPPGVNLTEGILYHCGPVVIKDEHGNWKCTAAGPTTSIREEPHQADVIRDLGLRGV